MFSHPVSQEDLKKRITDIEDLRLQHNQFRKLTEVKIKMLENENGIRKNDHEELVDTHKNLARQTDLIKEALDLIRGHMAASDQRIALMEKKLDDFLSARASLASQIDAARKRLENQPVVDKKPKTTK